MRKALVVGGAQGIGLSIATQLASREDIETVYIVDKAVISPDYTLPKFQYHCFDLTQDDYSIFDQFLDADVLMITAGLGKLALFEDLDESHIVNLLQVNTVATIRIIHRFYSKIRSSEDFYCGVMVSIAGFLSSPFFSVYGASKAALKIFIESVNIELEQSGSSNRILNVSPGSIRGTAFNGGPGTDLTLTSGLAEEIVSHLYAKDDLFIPQYEEVYKEVLRRYQEDFRKEGRHSYDYKLKSGRMK